MIRYLLQLGQNFPLSLAELQARVPEAKSLESLLPFVYFPSDSDPLSTLSQLGGLIKVATPITTFSENPLSELISIFHQSEISTFSLTQINGNSLDLTSLSQSLKDEFKSARKMRFVLSRKGTLSPLVLKKQKVTEFIFDHHTSSIYQTIWVHDFQSWIDKDRRKPYITPKQGMLPPKLARTMVNLGLGNGNPQNLTLLDPFCGTGTVLMEALELGMTVIGSDISSSQADGSRNNLDWLASREPLAKQYSVITCDATHVSQKIKQPIDLVVTEPSLGPVLPPFKKQLNIAKGLHKLYLGALKDWQNILAPKNTIVMAYPLFEDRKTLKYFHAFIDTAKDLGYNSTHEELIFTRPNGRIQRQIIILEKHGAYKTSG